MAYKVRSYIGFDLRTSFYKVNWNLSVIIKIMSRRYYYKNYIDKFIDQDKDYILGELARNHNFLLDLKQIIF